MIAPGGEFGFVILSVAAVEGLVPTEPDEVALLAVALTMACIPLLSGLGQRIGRRLTPPRQVDPALGLPAQDQSAPRVVIAGFGRVGQTVAAMLDVHKVRYVAIERDVDRVTKQRGAGHQVFYGDITRPDLLRNLNLASARALVVTMDDHRAVDEVVAVARAERPDLLIIARARDAAHAAHLYRTGASDAIPETVEASLQLSEAVLVDLGVPMGPVIASIHEKRAEFQARIKAFAPEAEIRPIGRRRLRDARGDSDVTEGAEQH
jgi:CPA2 family monovalent cation:H+ antiporter-2